MSWTRLLLTSDLGQQLDIQDVEEDVARLRARLDEQQSADRTHEAALLTLRREVTDLKLVIAELSRLLVASGSLSADAVERLVRGVERADRPT